MALRDLHNYYYRITGDSYIKTTCEEKYRAFGQFVSETPLYKVWGPGKNVTCR